MGHVACRARLRFGHTAGVSPVFALGLSRAQLARIFVQSLTAHELLASSAAHGAAPRVLSPAGFQQALLRVALLLMRPSAPPDGAAPGGRLPPSRMNEPQLDDVRDILVVLQVVAPRFPLSAKEEAARAKAFIFDPQSMGHFAR